MRSTRACGRTTGPAERDVVVYLVINALAWILQTTLVRGLARVGQDVVLGAARGSLRPPDDAVAQVLLTAKGGLDHLAAHLRRRRALGRALAGADDAGRQHADAASPRSCGLFILDWRLGLVALVILPPTLVLTRWFQVKSHAAFLRVRETISSMTAQVAESVSGMAVIQAYNRERAFLGEFDVRETTRTGARTPMRSGSTHSSSPASNCSGSSRWPRSCGSAGA